jgi:2-keto-4-pentenoate hydratase/2-oxohepta-3-ene-1,7-dioic acid hydratase in catechol pathway
MKLVRFSGGRIGVVVDDGVRDVTDAAGADAREWPPVGMVRAIASFDARRTAIEAAAAQATAVALDQAALEAPVVWPNKLLAYPVNYVAHGEEMRSANRADRNGFFLKAPSSLSGPREPIVLPVSRYPGREFHHECELAVVIGKRARHVRPENALDYVFGYSCLVDVTLRGEGERVMRKSFDTFCPMGPWVVTADEVGDPSALRLRLWVNGELRQDANTRDLIVDVPGMIAGASAVATLEPGDVIATGTPAGVGPIRPGDSVTIEIERVGRMTLDVVEEVLS